jgi:ketosteroid isomerase-like protein
MARNPQTLKVVSFSRRKGGLYERSVQQFAVTTRKALNDVLKAYRGAERLWIELKLDEGRREVLFVDQPFSNHNGGDLAFGHALIRCGGTDAEGKEHKGWVRATWAARRHDGRWRIVHEHYSLPFDPESMKVLGELEP